MKVLFIGPAEREDERIHEVTKTRVRLAKFVGFGDEADKPTTDDERRYCAYLAEICRRNETIDNVLAIYPALRKKLTEPEVLDGTWDGIKHFQHGHIRALRHHLETLTAQDELLCHVDLGDDLSTLYAAYMLANMGQSTSVTFHSPWKAREDGRVSFGIGGYSFYAQCRPLLRRALALGVLRGSQHVFVTRDGVASALAHLFPSVKHQYLGDPLFPVEPDPEPIQEPALSSQTEG